MSVPQITTADDLEGSREFTHSWLPEFTFSVAGLAPEERLALRDLAGVQAHFADPRADVPEFVTQFLATSRRHDYLVVIEHRSAVRSRVRSYKGLFSSAPNLEAGSSTVFEVELSGGYTHLVGLASVTGDTAHDCMRYFGDGTRAFIASSPKPWQPSSEFARDVLRATPGLPGPAYLNYARLLPRLCADGTRVLRMGGYSGEGDADLQVFTRKSDVAAVVEALRSTARA